MSQDLPPDPQFGAPPLAPAAVAPIADTPNDVSSKSLGQSTLPTPAATSNSAQSPAAAPAQSALTTRERLQIIDESQEFTSVQYEAKLTTVLN